jgi:VWFA-related protein
MRIPAFITLLAPLLFAPDLALAEAQSAAEIWDQVGSGARSALVDYSFRTELNPSGGFQLTLRRVSDQADASASIDRVDPIETSVIWSDGSEAFHFNSRLQQYKPVDSLTSEISQTLGHGTAQALMVPLLIAGKGQPVWNPTALSYSTEVACGDQRCHLLGLSSPNGMESLLMWVGTEDFLIRKLEASVQSPDAAIELALSDGNVAWDPQALATTFKVTHDVRLKPASTDPSTGFTLPPAAQRVVRFEPRNGEEPPTEVQDLVFSDEVSVALTTVVVRVVDNKGAPVLGLTPEDFDIKLGKQELPVMSVDWISSSFDTKLGSLPVVDEEYREETSLSAKQVIFWIQADFNAVRIKGHLRMIPFAARLLDSLHPNDFAAVLSYDSQLRLWQDFTREHEPLKEALERAIRFGGQAWNRKSSHISLSIARNLDFTAARKVASPEEALEETAKALIPLPGEKVIVYLGWGLGELSSFGFSMTGEYADTLAALDAARATVFVLDVTDAGYHTLEAGLQTVAQHTGGTYAKTSLFASQATNRLAGVLSGYYLLTVDSTKIANGASPVVSNPANEFSVELLNHKGTVLAKTR